MTVPTGTAQPSPSRLTTAEELKAGNLPAVISAPHASNVTSAMLVLQHAEASPSLSERSALRIQPLAIHADAWAKLPGVSKWVLNIIERGYSLQFRRRPRRYVARVETTVSLERACKVIIDPVAANVIQDHLPRGRAQTGGPTPLHSDSSITVSPHPTAKCLHMYPTYPDGVVGWSRSEGEGWEREEVMQTEGGREKQREGKLGKLPPHLLVHDVSDAAVSCRLGPQSRTSSPRSLWTFNSVLFVSACVLPFYLSLSLNTLLSSGNLSFAKLHSCHGPNSGKGAGVWPLSELTSQRYNKQRMAARPCLLRTTCPNLRGGGGEVKLRMDSRGKVEEDEEKRAGKDTWDLLLYIDGHLEE
ncbi:unnamed protein product [Leuciscus chuanchicus]